nr:hypothetical protein [Brevundimonas naejangsanensis]
MNTQVELAQAVQRDEVHARDQLAKFGAQVFAGVAFLGLLQIFRQAPIGLGYAGVQLDGLRGRFGQQGGQLLPACFQRRGACLQRVQVDHTLHEHDLGPFKLPADLGPFLLHRRAFALYHASVLFGGFLITCHRHGDRLGRHQVCLHARQHPPLNRGRGDDLAVGAGGGAPVVTAAADILAAFQRHGGAALVAPHQAGQQPLGLAAMRGGQGGQLGLAALDAVPQFVVDDPQVGDRLADPVFGRVQDGRAFAGVGVFAIFSPVEHAHAGVEFLVQNSVLGAAVSIDGRWSPRAAARPGHAGGVQAVGDGSGRFPFGVTLKNRAHHPGLVRVDRQFALGGQVVPKAPTAAAEAVFDARDKAAASFVAELGQEHLVHRALQADVEFGHVPL